MRFQTTRWLAALMAAMLLAVQTGQAAPAADQTVFKTPDEAVRALVNAIDKNDNSKLAAILGPDSKDLVASGDPVADKNARKHFLTIATQRCDLVEINSKKNMLQLGNDKWPFPIPLVKGASGWTFDTPVGKQEIINRRIGRNELETISFLHVFVDAERDYAKHIGGGAYAQRIMSAPGQHDGLYWEVAKGKPQSPLGPAVAEASAEGYGKKGAPYHGYKFKVLSAQGAAAPGGEKSYVKDGKMNGGFALIAWPARYGSSGVFTFLVSQNGIVYQKNLGTATDQAAPAVTEFNPDMTWKPVKR